MLKGLIGKTGTGGARCGLTTGRQSEDNDKDRRRSTSGMTTREAKARTTTTTTSKSDSDTFSASGKEVEALKGLLAGSIPCL